ncbi:MAG: putative acetamidase/formamidase [Armatimonadetes bacterium]|jgi:acetamidase/formamidase|nr:putative acetamidase/formamidase [Armatimonadota bacterium]
MLTVPAYPLVYELSRHLEPRASVEPGEMLLVQSEDALSGQIRGPGDRRDRTVMPFSNPVAGPIEVRGAAPGDTLAVRIHEIRPTSGQCATYTAPPRALSEWLGGDVPHGAHVCPIRDGLIYWSEELTLPYAPMLGCIGTAPDWGVPTTGPAGAYGGNMDLVEVAPGATLYLPVFVPGALLYLGDAHAAMGHGELSGTGLEMAAETRLTVDLIQGRSIPGPRIASAEELVAVATAGNLERAIAQATSYLILWLEAEFGWNRWRAYDLLTHAMRISIGYFGSGTVGAKIARSLAERPS